jgi:hypothetical protein
MLLLVAYVFLLIIVGASFLTILILYCVTLHRTLGRCSPERRVLAPGLVWLLLIPIVGYIWHFILVVSISISLKRESRSRRIDMPENPGLAVGLPMCIVMSSHVVIVYIIRNSGMMNFLLISASLVLWIIYWVVISRYSRKLITAKSRKK